MAPQKGKQTITIRILPNISRSKGKQTVRIVQLIEFNVKIIFHAEDEAGQLVPEIFAL